MFLPFTENNKEKSVINSAPILAIQLSCFSTLVGQLGKAKTLASCTQSKPSQYLTVPTTTEEKV